MKFLQTSIFFCLISSGVSGADWPTQGHDNQRSATTAEQLDISSLSLSWTWKPPLWKMGKKTNRS